MPENLIFTIFGFSLALLFFLLLRKRSIVSIVLIERFASIPLWNNFVQ